VRRPYENRRSAGLCSRGVSECLRIGTRREHGPAPRTAFCRSTREVTLDRSIDTAWADVFYCTLRDFGACVATAIAPNDHVCLENDRVSSALWVWGVADAFGCLEAKLLRFGQSGRYVRTRAEGSRGSLPPRGPALCSRRRAAE
jgi:hypothetical protein